MTDKTPSKSIADAAASTPHTNQRRRRLLQASMSAPFVASLQTSAAYANASAFQCVAKADEEAAGVAGLIPGDAHDAYVRVSIWGFTYKAGDLTKVFWDVTGGDANAPTTGDKLYAEDGSVLTVNNTDGSGTDQVNTLWTYQQNITPINSLALVLYDPDYPDYSGGHIDVLDDPTPVYPKFTIVQHSQIGMPQSCLCSVTGGNAAVCPMG
jgi:hypothetical protein